MEDGKVVLLGPADRGTFEGAGTGALGDEITR